MAKLAFAAAVAAVLALASSCFAPLAPDPRIDIASSDLKATQVVPTLDSPIPEGKNAIWCASFLCAWKTLAADLAGEPIALEGAPEAAASLNAAKDPRPDIPEDALYAVAGWKQDGVIDKIQGELKRRFPRKQPPTFPRAAENSFIAYSYLEANVKFSLLYFQYQHPLEFSDSGGRKTKITSFGIRTDDKHVDKLRAQPRVLFRKGGLNGETFEFAIDLCADSSPSQIVVARIAREPTLAAALERIDRESTKVDELTQKTPENAVYLREVRPEDMLQVPDMLWRISHRFAELENRPFANSKLRGQNLDVAQQDILFRLDRSGAELKSEAKMYGYGILYGPHTDFVLDRPFLICMKKRGAASPYFVMWVDNAELLCPWKEDGRP
ncbi:MAG: hypothetical protein NTW86_10235 [Candidatus Sumerlaeota bacterium]|nr:hypothetical protein [Candidatus Sumerlaeota bacterium]